MKNWWHKSDMPLFFSLLKPLIANIITQLIEQYKISRQAKMLTFTITLRRELVI